MGFTKEHSLWLCLGLVVPLCSFGLGFAFGKSEHFSFAGTDWPHCSATWGQKLYQHVYVVGSKSSHWSLLCQVVCGLGVTRLHWDAGGCWASWAVCFRSRLLLFPSEAWLTGPAFLLCPTVGACLRKLCRLSQYRCRLRVASSWFQVACEKCLTN